LSLSNLQVVGQTVCGLQRTWLRGSDVGNNTEDTVARTWTVGEDLASLAAFQELILDRTHDLITILDAAGTIVYGSPAWRTLGWDPAELAGTAMLGVVHPDDREPVARAIADVLAGGAVEAITLRLSTKAGAWAWYESTGSPISGAAGGAGYIVTTARDVTEREELRRRVAEVDALYRLAAAIGRATTLDELLSEVIDIVLDATVADRAAVQLFDEAQALRFRASRGLSPAYMAAVEGHSPWPDGAVAPDAFLIDDVDDAGLPADFERAAHEEHVRALAFVPLLHGDRLVGTFMLHHHRPHAWTEAEVLLCRTVASHLASVTVRTEAQQSLHASNERLATIMRTIDEGLVMQSHDGTLLYANEAAARFVGFASTAEFLGASREKVLGQFEILDDELKPLPLEELPGRRALRGETSERVLCYRIRATGEEHWSVVRANPVYDAGGTVMLAVSVIRDITAARSAEESARQSTALIEGVFGTVPVGLAFWDTDLRYVRVNEAFEQMYGVRAGDLLGRTLFELRQDDGDDLTPVIQQVLETGSPVTDLELAGERSDEPGVGRVWVTSFFPVHDRAGTRLGVGCSTSDVTAERNAREERARAESRIRFLARASDLLNETLDYELTLAALAEMAVPTLAGHVVIDLVEEDGSIRCVAAAHVDPARSAHIRDLRHRYPPTAADHPVQHAVRTGEAVYLADLQAHVDEMAHDAVHAEEIRKLANTSGIVVPLIARGRTLGAIQLGTVDPEPRFTDADVDLAVELARRASLALDNARLYGEAQARAHATSALEFVDDGVFLLDGDGTIRLWNPAAAHTFRVRASKAIGRPADELIRDWSAVQERIRVASGPSGGARRAQTVPVDVQGDERWLSISAVRFPGGTVYAFRDLTEERAVDQLKSDFVATVSHELRTPLAAIYGAALTLQRDDVRLDEAQRDGLLDVVASEADRLARIVNDILWASRLDSGQMGVSIESCDASKLVNQVVEALRSHTGDAVRLQVDVPDGLPAVAADSDKLRQVLMNLVDNAVKYSPDGGHVLVAVAHTGNRIRFRIEDHGLGIPPAEQDRIFEKFFRLDPSMTRGVGGTGLGLYICRELVDRMQGRIWVASDGRSGSTFTVELPVAG
jgi:PAS domain S-box-containing protein